MLRGSGDLSHAEIFVGGPPTVDGLTDEESGEEADRDYSVSEWPATGSQGHCYLL